MNEIKRIYKLIIYTIELNNALHSRLISESNYGFDDEQYIKDLKEDFGGPLNALICQSKRVYKILHKMDKNFAQIEPDWDYEVYCEYSTNLLEIMYEDSWLKVKKLLRGNNIKVCKLLEKIWYLKYRY